MPFINLQTNQQPAGEALNEFLDAAISAAAKTLAKSEDLFIAAANTGLTIRLAGSSKPAAMIDVAGLNLTDDYTGELTAVLTTIAAERLEIRPERIHVRFQNYERSMWGCNGKTFA